MEACTTWEYLLNLDLRLERPVPAGETWRDLERPVPADDQLSVWPAECYMVQGHVCSVDWSIVPCSWLPGCFCLAA